MRINMTLEAVGEFRQQPLIMGCFMAHLTFRDKTVTGVTLTTVHAAMLARGFRPWLIHAVMTCRTGCIPLGAAVIGNLQRFMHWMTGKAVRNLLSRQMGLMTFHTGRNPAMFFAMARITSLLGMLAWELRQLPIGAGMTFSAICRKNFIHG